MNANHPIYITGGTLISEEREFSAEILIEKGKIDKVQSSIKKIPQNAIHLDAHGKYIFPGGIDPHVHLHLPVMGTHSSDDFYSGSIAALHGGTTCLIDFITPQRGQPLKEAFRQRKVDAESSLIDYSFHQSIVDFHPGLLDEIKQSIKEGINSFKIYLAYQQSIGITSQILEKVLPSLTEQKALLLAHCETEELITTQTEQLIKEGKTHPKYHPTARPSLAEADAVQMLIDLVRRFETKAYLVHISAKESLPIITQAKRDQLPVYSETCPQYLMLNDRLYHQPAYKSSSYVMSPPLRKPEDQQALWDALKSDHFNVVATDHCPFHLSQKNKDNHDFRKIPGGAAGVQFRLPLLFTYGVKKGSLSLSQFVDLTSTQPAKIFDLFPQKGCLRKGSDADLIIWNPNTEWAISPATDQHNCDHSVYNGLKLQGKPETVLTRGHIALHNGVFDAPKQGRFLRRFAE